MSQNPFCGEEKMALQSQSSCFLLSPWCCRLCVEGLILGLSRQERHIPSPLSIFMTISIIFNYASMCAGVLVAQWCENPRSRSYRQL